MSYFWSAWNGIASTVISLFRKKGQGQYNNPADWKNYDSSAAPLVMIDQQTSNLGYGQPYTSRLNKMTLLIAFSQSSICCQEKLY